MKQSSTTTNNNNTDDSVSTNLDDLPLERLSQLKQQEEGRLQALTQRYAALRTVAARLHASQSAITELNHSESKTTENDDRKDVMIPLTESVYVPGTIQDLDSLLLVDIGTGFYVEMTSKQTNDYLSRKLKLVDANSESIMTAVHVTRQNLDAIHTTIQGKMLEIRARQEGQSHIRATMMEGGNNIHEEDGETAGASY